MTGARPRDTPARRRGGRSRRAQSHVVGVAVLLAATTLSLGLLTASVGVVIEDGVAGIDAGRVAADLEDSLRPVAATGVRRGAVSFTDGRLRTVSRTLRLFNDTGLVYRGEVGGLVFETGDARAAFVAGMVVRGGDGGARLYARPPISASPEVLLVGVARLNASGPDAVTARGARTVPLRTAVAHRRRALGDGSYRIAVETATPGPWERFFRGQGATTRRRDFDGDGVGSVVGRYRNRSAYLIVHDLALEVGRD